MTITLGFASTQPNPVNIRARNGGKCWAIYAPEARYTMLDRRTRGGAIRLARRTWPHSPIHIIDADGRAEVLS